MNIEQVITLINAGYTKAEIEAMQGGGSAAQPAQPAPETSAQPAQPAEQPAQTAPAEPEVKQAEPSAQPSSQGQQDDAYAYARLEAKLNQLIGLQQAGAINQTIPGSAAAVKTPEQILGSVIAPPERTKHK